MKYDAIIFDIDGTLWDTTEAVALGWNKGLEILGLYERVTEDGIKSVFGKTFEECLSTLLPGLPEKYPELMPEISRQTYAILENKGGKFYGGVIAGIKELSSQYKLFLISNCEEEYLEIFLNLSGLKEHFAGWDCHGMSGRAKDKMIDNFKNEYNLSQTAYVGDTASDQKAAELADVDFIYVTYGFGKEVKANPTFDNFPDLVDYLNKE